MEIMKMCPKTIRIRLFLALALVAMVLFFAAGMMVGTMASREMLTQKATSILSEMLETLKLNEGETNVP